MSEGQKWIKIGAIALAVFIILIIINAILLIFGIIGGFNRGTKDFTERYTNINNIEIDVNASSINIVKGDSFLVEAKGVSDNFRVIDRRNTLEIEEDSFLPLLLLLTPPNIGVDLIITSTSSGTFIFTLPNIPVATITDSFLIEDSLKSK